eukprot:EG_transcript_36254
MFRAIGGAVALRGPLWRAPVAGFASGRRPRPTTPAPEKWDTEEVMGWLRANSPMDASMEEALRMARVNGASLQGLSPNALYKAMRRAWLHPDKPVAVDEAMLQETAMLSFHYGAGPPSQESTQRALQWFASLRPPSPGAGAGPGQGQGQEPPAAAAVVPGTEAPPQPPSPAP